VALAHTKNFLNNETFAWLHVKDYGGGKMNQTSKSWIVTKVLEIAQNMGYDPKKSEELKKVHQSNF